MKVLFNLKRVNPFALILLLFLAGCETAEKVESKSDESSANETGIKITKAPSKDFKVTYIDQKKNLPRCRIDSNITTRRSLTRTRENDIFIRF